uniref:Conserved oligomeric Golgi complex subunit 8 n=1 Tax=Meloidogyne hapla TaxID=6305 RepID=A0A1I8C3H2_MELHA
MDEKINISKENSPTLLNHQFDYSDMHSMSLDELKNLRRKVESKVQNLQGELSDLAFHNYRTYVDVSTTAEYCREKFSQMDTLMRQSSSSFPNLEEQIDQFKNQSTQLLNEFKLLSDVESTNFLIWEIIRLPKSEPDFILRVIEVYRECMYDTIILYLAVFPDTDTQQRFVNEDTRWERWTGSSQNYLLQCWAQKNIERLLSYVQCCEYKSLLDIEMMVSKLMSCAFSFGRMGLDFRPLVHCKFSQMVLNIFQNKIEAATKSFTSNEKIDLIDDGIFETTQSELKKEISRVDLSAPLELCIWDDLCIFGNSIIDALNEIRHSIYINSIRRVFNILHFSFQNIFAWMDSFLSNQENIFIVKKATFLLIKQFLPFINNCFFSCFPYEQCAKKYFTIGNCSLNEYKNTFNLMNLNIFGLCKNESLFFEMIKEFDLKENEEQNILIEEESINTKNLENEEIVKNEEEEKKEENLQVE